MDENTASEQENPANTSSTALETTPRRGTLAWLETLPTVELAGRTLPNVHRCNAGTFRTDEERGKRCAYVKPSGDACNAPATKRFGVCVVHCGGGSDPAAMSPLGTAKLARLRVTREVLGVGPRGMGNPRVAARLAAAERAGDIAAALLAPLDSRKLAPLERQRAAATILQETFPLQATSLELELPASSDAVAGMGWEALQQLAARMLDQT